MTTVTIKLRRADIACAVGLIAFSLATGYVTTTWIPPILPGDPGAAFFPRIAICVIFVFSVLLMAQHMLRARKAGDAPAGKTVRVEIGQFGATVLYSGLLVVGTGVIGFEVSAFAFLFVLLGLRTGRWGWAAITSAVSTVAMYLIFVLVLTVRLPLALLPAYISF